MHESSLSANGNRILGRNRRGRLVVAAGSLCALMFTLPGCDALSNSKGFAFCPTAAEAAASPEAPQDQGDVLVKAGYIPSDSIPGFVRLDAEIAFPRFNIPDDGRISPEYSPEVPRHYVLPGTAANIGNGQRLDLIVTGPVNNPCLGYAELSINRDGPNDTDIRGAFSTIIGVNFEIYPGGPAEEPAGFPKAIWALELMLEANRKLEEDTSDDTPESEPLTLPVAGQNVAFRAVRIHGTRAG